METGQPTTLGESPLIVPAEEALSSARLVGRGLGYDVYRLSSKWVLKVAARRHEDVTHVEFTQKQTESYNFLVAHLGQEHVCRTYLFRCPLGSRLASCAVQQAVWGRALAEITVREFQRSPRLRQNVRGLVDRALRMAEQTGRMPDLWDGTPPGIPAFVPFRDARYTTNIRVDDQERPFLIDIGAWPKGFDRARSVRGAVRVAKMVHDLKRFRRSELTD
jgi:hypothetical protein